MQESGGALQTLGITPLPIGTLDELKEAGIDPAQAGSCAPSQPSAGIRGCAMWKQCPFGQARLGGFKGKSGPKYVGYFLMTHEGDKKEDFISCHAFVRVLLSRMKQMVVDRNEGRIAETVRIIAQEGEKIFTRSGVPDNPADKSINAAYHYAVKEIEVPKMPRPLDDNRTTYDLELAARERARKQIEVDVEDEIFGRLKDSIPDDDGERFQPIRKKVGKGKNVAVIDDDDLDNLDK